MAIYVPRARRRRNTILVGVAAMVVGVLVGAAAGRSTAPTVEDRVKSVRSEARAIASQLRVVSLHETSAAASIAAGGDAGADLALKRAETDLRALFRRAPWVTTKVGGGLIAETAELRAAAPGQASSPEFGKRVDALADRIESIFGG